jgi:hypothetical protein
MAGGMDLLLAIALVDVAIVIGVALMVLVSGLRSRK